MKAGRVISPPPPCPSPQVPFASIPHYHNTTRYWAPLRPSNPPLSCRSSQWDGVWLSQSPCLTESTPEQQVRVVKRELLDSSVASVIPQSAV